MTDQNNSLREDIAFLRAMAEDGRSHRVHGGSVMLASGLIFGTASLLIWAGLQTGLAKPAQLTLVWPAAGLLFFAYLWLFLRGLPKGERRASANGMAWSALGWAIFVCVVSLIVIAVRTGQDAAAAAISPVILSFYGAGWCIAGSVMRRPWPYACGFGSFGAALITAWSVPAGDLMFLLYAISLYVLVAAPGFHLMRRDKAA